MKEEQVFKKFLTEMGEQQTKESNVESSQQLINSFDAVTIHDLLEKYSNNKDTIENMKVKFLSNGHYVSAKGVSVIKTIDGKLYLVFHE